MLNMWKGGEDYFLVGKEDNFIDPEAEASLLEDAEKAEDTKWVSSTKFSFLHCIFAADFGQVSSAAEVQLQGSNTAISSFLCVAPAKSRGLGIPPIFLWVRSSAKCCFLHKRDHRKELWVPQKTKMQLKQRL